MTPDLRSAIENEGWAVTAPVVPVSLIDDTLAALAPAANEHSARAGIRNLLETSDAVRDLAVHSAVRSVAETILGPSCFAVRAILFDKTPTANWKVIWHQDLTIAVKERADVEGFGPWSEKEGLVHVQPPSGLLERMLAVRVHLDDSDAENGPVRVLPGSHRDGRLSGGDIDQWRKRQLPVDCLAARGAIIAFRPLILHASSPAKVPAHRRVVHFEFAADELPAPLQWRSRVGRAAAPAA